MIFCVTKGQLHFLVIFVILIAAALFSVPTTTGVTTSSLIATRGCHNRCGFCYLATDGLRMPYRMRDPEQIAREIEKMKRVAEFAKVKLD